MYDLASFFALFLRLVGTHSHILSPPMSVLVFQAHLAEYGEHYKMDAFAPEQE